MRRKERRLTASLLVAAASGMPSRVPSVQGPGALVQDDAAVEAAVADASNVTLVKEQILGHERRLVNIINERFATGRPTNKYDEAGVFIHQFDDQGFDPSTHRLKQGGVAKHWMPWQACPAGEWCSKFGDRFSVSVMNARVPYAFNEFNGGMILSPTVADESTMCAWATDARSFRASRTCMPAGMKFEWGDGEQLFERREGCVPGCVIDHPNALEDWDTPMAGQRAPGWCGHDALKTNEWCPWKSNQLKQMMEQQEHGFLNTDCAQNNGCRYNEVRLPPPTTGSCPAKLGALSLAPTFAHSAFHALSRPQLVLNSSTWVDRLPATVEAFFIVRGSRDDSAPAITAREAHVKFLTMYNRTSDDIPMLELDLLAASEGVSAINIFREVENPMLKTGLRQSKTSSRFW